VQRTKLSDGTKSCKSWLLEADLLECGSLPLSRSTGMVRFIVGLLVWEGKRHRRHDEGWMREWRGSSNTTVLADRRLEALIS
jgi:hypothetical protein